MPVLDLRPLRADFAALAQDMRIKAQSSQSARLKSLLDEAQDIAQPKALYQVALIEKRRADRVVVDGVAFSSRVLRVNLAQTRRIFPFVCTAGVELEAWVNSQSDFLQRFWADAIAELTLHAATQALQTHLTGRYRPGPLAMMNPGSLDDWPLTQQRPLFALLGDVQQAIGVTLLDSMLMSPTKTVSGLYFAAQEGFVNCQLCPREACRARQSPYEPDLYRARYQYPDCARQL